MIVSEVVDIIDHFAPFELQEKYDNVGLQIGDLRQEVSGILVTIDVTEDVVDEALSKGCNLILAHHPLIFGGLKSLTGKTYVERTVIKAIINQIAVLVSHTNLDSVNQGVSFKMCEKLNLQNCTILSARHHTLLKLVTFVPQSHFEEVQEALYLAGAGEIGDYSNCGFSQLGSGTFKASPQCKPFVGEIDQLHVELEMRFETILPFYKKDEVISALKKAHPYEDVAYDIYQLENRWEDVGLGMVGELSESIMAEDFLRHVKDVFDLRSLKYTSLPNSPIKRVAVCGGSGSEFLKDAIRAKADIYISGDFKYHQFFDAESRIVIADIGHYESEQFTKELFFEILTKKLPTFAICKSSINTNPIKYL